MIGFLKLCLVYWEAPLLTVIFTVWGSDIALICEPLATYIIQECGDPFSWLEPLPTDLPGYDPTAETYYV